MNVGGSHVKPRVDAVRADVSSARDVGASGMVIIIAPLPAFDSVDAPFSLIATIFAKIDEPYGSEQGAALRVETGMVQELAVTIAGKAPLQLTESTVNVAPSLYRTLIT